MDNYRKIEIKGKGSYGQAILVQQKYDRKFYIMKVIDVSLYDRKQKEQSLNEINVLKSLCNPFIIRYKESFVDKGRYLCIVMEYADSGTLDQKIQEQKSAGVYFSEDQVLDWFTQICLGIKYVHDKKIIHRDLKLQNIFMSSNNQIKLGDFGIARVLSSTEELCSTNIGTPYYISPEICQVTFILVVKHIPYNHKSDIWSLGCILYELLTLRHAFDARNIEGLILKIVRGQVPLIKSHYSPQVKELVQDLLQREPEKRPSIDEILSRDIIKQRIAPLLKTPEPNAEDIEKLRMEIEVQVPFEEFKQIYGSLQRGEELQFSDPVTVSKIKQLIQMEKLVFTE